MKVLLVQARRVRDPMLRHEQECVARKAEDLQVQWSAHNAFEAPAGPELLAGVDAVMIGGSGDFSVHDPRSRRWLEPMTRLIDAALEQGVPGFGICFGHQVLGEVMGGTVALDHGTAEVGTVSLRLTDAGLSDPVFGKLGPVFQAHTGHTDRVAQTPAGVELLATGDTLTTQAFRVRGAPFWSAQFHPDLTGAEARSRYLAYQDALLSDPNDGGGGNGGGRNDDPFEQGADDTERLLSWFLEQLAA